MFIALIVVSVSIWLHYMSALLHKFQCRMFCDGVCFGMNNLVNIHKLFFIMLHYYASFYNIDSVEDSYKVQGISCTVFL